MAQLSMGWSKEASGVNGNQNEAQTEGKSGEWSVSNPGGETGNHGSP